MSVRWISTVPPNPCILCLLKGAPTLSPSTSLEFEEPATGCPDATGSDSSSLVRFL